MGQIKKIFILTQFGSPHSWTQQYFDNVAKLEQYGWYWLIVTPNKYDKVPKNVRILDMDIETFNSLMNSKIGVNPQNYLENGVPHKAVSDFYVASGAIFEDYIRGFNFWGITNWDIVYGRLDHFIKDEKLEKCEVFTDDVNTINGIFCLFKNTPKINNLFKKIPNWEKKFTEHRLFGIDEYDMTEVMKNSKLNYSFPKYYPMHSHDRLEQHVPDVKLEMKANGSLWELYKDTNPPNWIHARKFIGREIPLFHFLRTKTWPNIVS